MMIQPSVQSASAMTTFASSVSATGVEQTVSRAPLAPVEESARGAGPQNRTPSDSSTATTRIPSGQQAQPAEQPDAAKTGQGSDNPRDSSTNNSRDTTASAAEPSVRQEQANQALIAQLRARDREVRVHEAAHAAVGGQYAGAATFEYRRGPDGRNYVVGGEVSISTGAESGDPQATIQKARTIRAAALAPAEPSAQDRRVAAEAAQMELNARTELRQQEIQARADAEKARQQQEGENKTEAEKPQEPIEETGQVAEVEKAPPEPVFTPVAVAPSTGADEKDSDTTREQDSKPQPNARERLEKILLGSTGILEQANRQGLVNPQNPYGKSGFLDVIA